MIISKKEGVINEIIYNMTVVNGGKSKIYLTLETLSEMPYSGFWGWSVSILR